MSVGGALLELKGVALRPALEAVDLKLERGRIVALLGDAGCGKTPLLKIACGLLRPDAGEVWLRGEGPPADLARATEAELLPLRLHFGVAFQNLALFDRMTLLDNVIHPLRRRGTPLEEARERAVAQLAAVGLSGSEAKLPHELSGGMRRRAALARALVAEPEVCLFDDPFTGLDPVACARIARLIALAVRRKPAPAVLVAAADPAPLRALADEVVVLERGNVRASATS
jgi:phospholipid/cholesterol/gamma-HCH transport system ATP-binding protein